MVAGRERHTALILHGQGKLFQVSAIDVASGAGESQRGGQAIVGGLYITRSVSRARVKGSILLARKNTGRDDRYKCRGECKELFGSNHPDNSCLRPFAGRWFGCTFVSATYG